MKKVLSYLYQFETFEDYGREFYLYIGCFPRVRLFDFSLIGPSTCPSEYWMDYTRLYFGFTFFCDAIFSFEFRFLQCAFDFSFISLVPEYEKHKYNE